MRFGRFAGLVLSPFFVPPFYRDVARSWGGIGLLYLFLLFTITWLPSLVMTQIQFRKFANEDFPKVANKVPDISIKNGRVSSNVEQPYEIKDDNGNVIFVLDTTGEINNLDQTKAMLLVTETKMHQRDQANNIQIHDLTTFPDFELSAERIQGWVDTIGTWLVVGLYPFVMFGSMIRALFIMLIASIIGVIVNSSTGNRVSYGGILRLAAVGLTMSVYIDTGMDIARRFEMTTFQIPFWFAIALALTCLYVAFGVVVTGPLAPEQRQFDDEPLEADRPRGGYDDGYPPDDGGFKPAKL